MNRSRKIQLVFILMLLLNFVPHSKAFEPSSMVAAAPQAAALAALWSPHAIRAMSSAGIGLYKMGEATFNIMRLPLGLLQCTLGAPFGFFDSGADNCVSGTLAPCQLAVQALMLPVRIISLGTIR